MVDAREYTKDEIDIVLRLKKFEELCALYYKMVPKKDSDKCTKRDLKFRKIFYESGGIAFFLYLMKKAERFYQDNERDIYKGLTPLGPGSVKYGTYGIVRAYNELGELVEEHNLHDYLGSLSHNFSKNRTIAKKLLSKILVMFLDNPEEWSLKTLEERLRSANSYQDLKIVT